MDWYWAVRSSHCPELIFGNGRIHPHDGVAGGGGYIMGGGMIYGGMDLRRERPMEPTDAFFCLSGSSRRMDRCY